MINTELYKERDEMKPYDGPELLLYMSQYLGLNSQLSMTTPP